MVGAVDAPIQFIGVPSGLVGVTQINFQVPPTAPLGDQPVVVTIGTVDSLPAKITVNLELKPADGSEAKPQLRYADLGGDGAHEGSAAWIDVGRKLRFESLPVGEWSLAFDVSDDADPTETVRLSPTSWRTQRKTMYKALSTVKVVSGETATVKLQ